MKYLLVLLILFSLTTAKAQLEEFTAYSLEEALENPEKTHKLILRNKGLEYLPETIGDLINITEIYVDSNSLNYLYLGFSYLTQLKKIDLSHNQFTSFNPSLTRIDSLETLDLSYNKVDHN